MAFFITRKALICGGTNEIGLAYSIVLPARTKTTKQNKNTKKQKQKKSAQAKATKNTLPHDAHPFLNFVGIGNFLDCQTDSLCVIVKLRLKCMSPGKQTQSVLAGKKVLPLRTKGSVITLHLSVVWCIITNIDLCNRQGLIKDYFSKSMD